MATVNSRFVGGLLARSPVFTLLTRFSLQRRHGFLKVIAQRRSAVLA